MLCKYIYIVSFFSFVLIVHLLADPRNLNLLDGYDNVCMFNGLLFADDFVGLSDSKQGLQDMRNVIISIMMNLVFL